MIWRSVVVLCGIAYPLYRLKLNPLKSTNSMGYWIAARCIIGQTCFVMFTYSLTMIPLSISMLLFQTAPFWTSILGYFINREPIQRIEYVAMILCFIGVAAIASSKGSNGAESNSESTKLLGITIAFVTAWFYAGCNVLNRKLKEVHFTVLGFFHPLTGLIISMGLLLI